MGSKIALKNAQDQEFSINHNDNAGAISINSSDISLKSQTESDIAPYNKGFKNYIINGGFDIDQYKRGIQSNWSSPYCYTDRFLVANSSNVQRNGAGENNNPTGFTNHLSVYKTAGADTQIIQRWEIPKDKAKTFLNGRTLTFSCWVLSDVSNIIEYMFFIKYGATVNAYEVKTFSITKNNTANIWTRITGTISNIQWTYDAGDYIEIRIDPFDSKAGTIHTTGWQLEEGSVATPFEQRPIGLELSLCQRYYEVMNGHATEISATTGEALNTSTTFSVRKRITPTMNRTQINQSGNPTVNLAAINNWGFYKELICTTTGVSYSIDDISASAEL